MGRFLMLGGVILLAGAGLLVYLTRIGGGDILVEGPRLQAPGADGTGYLYLTLRNTGGQPDTLIGVETPVSEEAGLHAHYGEYDDHETPHALTGVPIAAGGQVSLDAEGSHIELRGMADGFEEGQLVPVTLRFERAGTIAVNARVLKPGDAMAAHRHGAGGASAKHDHGELHEVGAGEPVPTISLNLTEDEGGGWNLEVVTAHFSFSPGNVNGPHVPGEGHAHLYADGVKIARLYGPWFHIGSLPEGTRRISVTLNTNDHKTYGRDGQPISAEAALDVLN